MNKSIVAFRATVAIARAAAAAQPDAATAASLGSEVSAGWNLVCQDAT